MAVPMKYKKMKDFRKYYSGNKTAPVLTIFVGGNHEAMNYLKDLYYGGWVAENIYFLGYSGVINIDGLRIAGVSGIHNGSDCKKGYFEDYPYDRSEIRSAFHTRQYEIMKLSLVKEPIDIFLSHDWPTVVGDLSDFRMLTRIKPFFKKDLQNHCLGSPFLSNLCDILQPRFWFAAHLHIHWEVDIEHKDRFGDHDGSRVTHFMSLDKPIINRGFMDILSIQSREKAKNEEIDNYKRLYSSMKKFCPSNFEVVSDVDAQSDSSMPEEAEGEGEFYKICLLLSYYLLKILPSFSTNMLINFSQLLD